MILNDKKLIIFDFDGTLIDSVPDLANSINFMLSKLRRSTHDIDLIRAWVGNGATTLVKRSLMGKGEFIEDEINKNLFEQALPIFLEHYETNSCVETFLYEGVQDTLEVLKGRGFTMVIVTNKPYKFIAPILSSLGIEEYFDLLIGADSLKEKKPSAEPLLHVMKELSFTKEETLMVGDSKNDIIAAKNAQIDSVAVSYGYNYGQDIGLYAPTIVIEKFSNILEHLN
ncbi:phosphoglycolate phosphatase [Sulfurimonas sp.]|uniref:phosphoglycolate phosphatase n=1 Tax=Sulfurimonas sp. TaxID=2022749 RepID=UPI003D0A5515